MIKKSGRTAKRLSKNNPQLKYIIMNLKIFRLDIFTPQFLLIMVKDLQYSKLIIVDL